MEKRFIDKVINQRQLIFMSLPLVLYVILFAYVPLWGWTMAFQDFRPGRAFSDQEWVGLQWFRHLFVYPESSPHFFQAMRNTLAMSVINMILGFTTAIGFALLLNELKNIRFKRIVQTVSYLPHFLSWVIVTGIVSTMLAVENGAINDLLMFLRIINEPILFLSEPNYFWGIVGATFVWKEVGWNTIIYLAAIAGIDPGLYEAAEIDGCNRFRKMWHVTLPGIKPTIIVLLILSIGRLLDAGFELQWLLRNGLIQDVSDTINIYVLIHGIRTSNFSLGTAAGMFQNVTNITLLFLANWLAKRAGEVRLI
ncbi:MAG: ABC transporter permease subunit [Treponema sp.]|nr:ABC transporter permease subunit [Treponema sp.]